MLVQKFPTTILVTVTYGHRLTYVESALASAFAEGVGHAIVIDNGSVQSVKEILRAKFGTAVTIERLERNVGSAIAFKRGIEKAVAMNAELVLLLDDDNELRRGSLKKLMSARGRLAEMYGNDNCAVVGKRLGHDPPLLGKVKNCFLGFHVRDIPRKVAKRLKVLQKPCSEAQQGNPTRIAYSPYSSLLFHRAVTERHGLPNTQFILYADDSEFTFRITAAGGALGLVEDVEITDQDASWNAIQPTTTFLKELVDSPAETRVYYTVRNLCYFEETSIQAHSFVRGVNEAVVKMILHAYCIARGKRKRWRLLNQALLDAREKRLGLASDPQCALP